MGTGVRSDRIEDVQIHPIHDLPISVLICNLTTSFSQQHQHHSCLSPCPCVLFHQSSAQPIVRPQDSWYFGKPATREAPFRKLTAMNIRSGSQKEILTQKTYLSKGKAVLKRIGEAAVSVKRIGSLIDGICRIKISN